MRKTLAAILGVLVSILTVLTVINVSTAATSAPAPGPVLAVTPSRIMDTRNNFGVSGPIAPMQDVSLQVSGRGGVPSSARSVFLNVTATQPTAGGYITIYPTGSSLPNASSLNFFPGQTTPNLVIILLGTGGKIQLFNGSAGTVHLIADVTGYVDTPGATPTTSASTTASATTIATTTTPTTPPSTIPAVWERHLTGQVSALPSSSTDVVAVAGYHDLFELLANGTVRARGHQGSHGQLGDGSHNYWGTDFPVMVSGLTNVTAIASNEGSETNYALKFDGTVWAWGRGDSGELGNGDYSDSYVPVLVGDNLTNISQIAAAGWASTYGGFACALRSTDGAVLCWGSGWNGILGNGSNVDRNTPYLVSGLTDVVSISVDIWNGYAVKADGTVWGWGNGVDNLSDTGTLGQGQGDSFVPIQIAGLTGVTKVWASRYSPHVIKSDGTVWAWGGGLFGNGEHSGSYTPVRVPALDGATNIQSDGTTRMAIKADGTVLDWDEYGPTPIPVNGFTEVTSIAESTYILGVYNA